MGKRARKRQRSGGGGPVPVASTTSYTDDDGNVLALRDELIALAQRQVLAQACRHPFHLLPVELAQQTTGAGTTFLRWRRHDRSAMGVALWQELMASTSTPVNLLADLHAIELQRIVLNLQISLLHTLGRQARECASKAAQADDAYLRRMTAVASRRSGAREP